MNEERLKHIEDMVEQLIRIGGNAAAAIEELRKGLITWTSIMSTLPVG